MKKVFLSGVKSVCLLVLAIVVGTLMSVDLVSKERIASQQTANSVLPDGVELLPQDDISSVERVFPNYPHNQDLSQVFTYKLGLDYGGLEVGNPSLRQERATVEEVLDYMEKIDNLTRGIPKIAVLVGYQEGGHDWQYPAMTPLNSKIISTEHPEWDGPTCIRYIMEASKKFNTKCTVHTNFIEAYEDSPWYPYYKENKLVTEKQNWVSPHGTSYFLDMEAAFRDPNGHRRHIAELLKELPEIIETGVLYADANFVGGGIYNDIVSWVKNTYDVDLIGEFGPIAQYGYVTLGMSWSWAELSDASQHPMKVPAYIVAGGEGSAAVNAIPSNTEIGIFGGSIQMETTADLQPSYAASRFNALTLPYFFLNTKLRKSYDKQYKYAEFSDNIVSMVYSGTVEDISDYKPQPVPVSIRRVWEGPDNIMKYLVETETQKVVYSQNRTSKSAEWYKLYDNDQVILQNAASKRYLAAVEGRKIVTVDNIENASRWTESFFDHGSDKGNRMYTNIAGIEDAVYMGSNNIDGENMEGDQVTWTPKSEITDWTWSAITFATEEAISTEPITFERLWEKSEGGAAHYFYDDGNGQLLFGTDPAGNDEYFWQPIQGEHGIRYKNVKTGKYLAVCGIAQGDQDMSKTIETRAIAEDGDFDGAEWNYTYGGKPGFNDYAHVTTEYRGQTVYLGFNVKEAPLGTIAGTINREWSSIAWRPVTEREFSTGMINNEYVIAQDDVVYRIGGDNFIPVVWREKEIMVTSQDGCTRTWKLPKDWADVSTVDIYDITESGLTLCDSGVDVSNGFVTVSVDAKKAKTIVPTGVDPKTNIRQSTNGTALYVGTDTETAGNWQGVYGTAGYSIAGGEESLNGVSVKVIGAETKVWENATGDSRALLNGDNRIAAAYTSTLHQIIDLNVGDVSKKVSVYLLDWENESSQTMVEVIDPNTLKSMSAVLVNDYSKGKYVSFNVSGHVQIRFTRIFNEDFSEVGAPYVAGVFFDGVGEVVEKSKEANIYTQPYLYHGKGIVGEESTIAISAISRDCGSLEYQWQQSTDGVVWNDIEGAVGDKYVFTSLSKEDRKKRYRCVVTNTRRGWQSSVVTSETFKFENTIECDNENLVYMGRVDFSTGNPRFIWTGSGVKTRFYGTELTAVFSAFNGKVAVWLDGERKDVKVINSSQVRVSSGICEEGWHDVEFRKVSCLENGDIRLVKVFCDGELSLPEIPELKLEFYGNSVAEGYAAAAMNEEQRNSREYDDHGYAYPFLVSKTLNADYHNVSISGIALTDGAGYLPYGMQSRYCLIDPNDVFVQWDFSRFTPDICIMALGINDTNCPGNTNENTWRENYKQMVFDLQSKYGKDTKFVFTVPPMVDAEAEVIQWSTDLVDELKQSGVYAYQYIFKLAKVKDHPIASEQQIIADELSCFLEDYVVNDNPSSVESGKVEDMLYSVIGNTVQLNIEKGDYARLYTIAGVNVKASTEPTVWNNLDKGYYILQIECADGGTLVDKLRL